MALSILWELIKKLRLLALMVWGNVVRNIILWAVGLQNGVQLSKLIKIVLQIWQSKRLLIHSLDMGRFAGAVIALHHDAAIERKTRQDGESGVVVEEVVGVKRGRMGARLGITLDAHVAVDGEKLASGILRVRQVLEIGHDLGSRGREEAGPD